jgi:rhodanese-related sulfurtransferase
MNYSEVPQLQRFHIPEVKHVLPTEASTQIEAGLVLPVDVREASEIDSTSIDCYQLLIHPMSGILDTMNDLPREKPLIIICEHGWLAACWWQRTTFVWQLQLRLPLMAIHSG